MNLIGHHEIKKFFDNLIANKKLANVYIFVGEEHLGKLTLARILASQLLQVNENKLNINPDFLLIDRSRTETGSLKKDISIEQAQKLIDFLQQKPFGKTNYQVVIINNAQYLNRSSSNALLKILENITGQKIVFLITNNEDRLLETIKSRGQIIYFHRPSQVELENYLKETNKEFNQDVIRLSFSLPGLLKQNFDNKKIDEINLEVNRFYDFFNKYFYEKRNLITDLFGNKENHIEERQKLKQIIGYWQVLIHDQLCYFFEQDQYLLYNNKADLKLNLNKLIKIYNALEKTKKLLEQNINPPLLIENILLII